MPGHEKKDEELARVSETHAQDNGSDTKDNDEQIEVAGQSQEDLRPGRRNKFKRHCARWWWVHVLIFCACFLIIALCLVYVAMPKIAQQGVDDTYLELTELDFLEPRPDGLILTQKAILHSPSMYTPTLDSFNTTLNTVYLNGTKSEPFVTLSMPRIHALHPKSSVTVQNNVTFTNMDALNAFVVTMLTQENVTTELIGKTKLHLGALPVVTVDYDSLANFKALNGMAGLNVTDAKLNFSAATNQSNFAANAFIPNPSSITVDMGNVTLSLSTEKEGIVGTATILNLTLRPGNNSLPMTAIINQTLVVASMNGEGMVDMSIRGTGSVYNGQHLTYYENALATNVLKVEMNVTQIVADSL